MPIIDGAIIWLRPAIIAIIGSLDASGSAAAGRPSDTASSVKSGRYASSVRCAHTPGVVSSSWAVGVSNPVTSRTCISAIGARLSNAMRTRGSTFCSAVPPVDESVANCRAASQFNGP